MTAFPNDRVRFAHAACRNQPREWAAYTDDRYAEPSTGELVSGQVVGFVAVEFDASGRLMGDGKLYLEFSEAQDVVERRNLAEGQPDDPLDLWHVMPVVAQSVMCRAAVRRAAARLNAADAAGATR